MTISEAVNAKNSKCWRKKTQNNEGLSPIMGKISMVRYQQPWPEDYRKRDFAPDSPEIKFSDRREALELMTQIESTVTSLHREAEAQFRPELEKIVSGIETGFRGTACTPQKTLPVASMPASRMRALP